MKDKEKALLVILGLATLGGIAGATAYAGAERVEEVREVKEKEEEDVVLQGLDYVVNNYAPEDVKNFWNTLTPEQKMMLASTIASYAAKGIPALQDALTSLAEKAGGALAGVVEWLKEHIWELLIALGIGAAVAAGGGFAGVPVAYGLTFAPV